MLSSQKIKRGVTRGSVWPGTVRGMKKVLLAAVGLSGVLASCGSVAVGDGAIAQVTGIRTEYRLSNGQFVGCDNVLNNGVQGIARTQVAVYFNVTGTVQSVSVGLRGNTDNRYDGNYNATFSGSEFDSIGGNSYKVSFDASPATGGFLPQAIVVNPVDRTVKLVTAENLVGSFYADLTIRNATDSATASTRSLGNGNIPVYTNCYVQRDTGETI